MHLVPTGYNYEEQVGLTLAKHVRPKEHFKPCQTKPTQLAEFKRFLDFSPLFLARARSLSRAFLATNVAIRNKFMNNRNSEDSAAAEPVAEALNASDSDWARIGSSNLNQSYSLS
jgi:hypothetical protein